MRVTNERAQSALKAHHITGNMTNIVKDYAADILEARELIKEMREVLNATRKTYSNEILTLAKMRIDEVLEKTKEYQ